jgi:hypothetical protein
MQSAPCDDNDRTQTSSLIAEAAAINMWRACLRREQQIICLLVGPELLTALLSGMITFQQESRFGATYWFHLQGGRMSHWIKWSNGKAPDLYSTGDGFESRHEHRRYPAWDFPDFPQTPQEITEAVAGIGHDRFIPNIFQFIICPTSRHYVAWATDDIVTSPSTNEIRVSQANIATDSSCYLLHDGFWLSYFLILKMEATCSSETSVDIQRTPRGYIPEDRPLYFCLFLSGCLIDIPLKMEGVYSSETSVNVY